MRQVVTVEGPISPDELGFTSSHEHILIDLTDLAVRPEAVEEKVFADEPVSLENLWRLSRDPLFVNRDNLRLTDVDQAVKELLKYRAAGGRSLVDMTCTGLGQDPRALRAIAIRSGVRIVASCGFYVAALHTGFARVASVESLHEAMLTDLTAGIADTGIRPGILGELGTGAEIEQQEEKVLRAGARAQRDTGAAINVHTHLWSPQGMRALDILDDEGADLTRVVISHVDHGTIDLGYQAKLAIRGAVLEYDGFGKEWYVDSASTWFPRDTERIDAMSHLISEGYRSQLLAGGDLCTKMQLTAYGGWGYQHLPRNIVPLMRRLQMTEEDINAVFVENPKRLLAISQ